MTNLSSYQPFLIGQFGAGQFQYLQPWQSPDDAFEPLENAYTYRGSLYKRQGYQKTGHTGLLRYSNNQIVTHGNGVLTHFTGTLAKFPVEAGSVKVAARVATVILHAADDSIGNIAGPLIGAPSTINYITGAYDITTIGPVDNTAPIVFQYTFTNSNRDEVIATGNGINVDFTGTLSSIPVVPLSLQITSTTLAGPLLITDDGVGNLISPLIDITAVDSTIDYATGDYEFHLTSPVVNLTQVIATYIQVGTGSPIMGINYWEDETNSTEIMTVEDQRRMAIFNTVTRLFDPISTFSQVIWQGNATDATFTLTLPFVNIAPYTVSVTDGTSTIIDNGTGNFNSSGNFAAGGTINYTSGAITINFTAAPAATIFISISASLQGDYFTGTDINFFKFTNWKANDSLPGYLYLTNNKDRVTLFDGTNLSRPSFPILEAQIQPHQNGIVTTLDLKVYKNRMLFLRPTVNTYAAGFPLVPTGTIIEGQIVRYSSEFYTFGTNTIIPFDFVADVSGHGGLSEAPTADWIVSAEFLRDAIVFFMQKTTWLFRFTGAAFSPFRWDQINNSRTCNAPYGSISYDANVTAMGTKGLIACDGVNVERYDIAVIDQYVDIDNDNFIQCFAERDDILYQGWMLYPSREKDISKNRFSDKAIIYNFLEKAFATYKINLTCLGVANTYTDITWADFAVGSGVWTAGKTWEECNFPWNKFTSQNLAPALYGGNQDGYVFILNVTETDNGAHIDTFVKSKRWNPFIQSGERCRFGYIDFYYEINPDVTIQVDIYINNATGPSITKMLTLDGPINDDFAWKRLQVNNQGEFIRIVMSTPVIVNETDDINTNDGTFLISGIILWAMSAGRLVPGGFP